MQASAFTFPSQRQKCTVNEKPKKTVSTRCYRSEAGVTEHVSARTPTWSLTSLDRLFKNKNKNKDTAFCLYCAHKSVPCVQPNI